MWLALLLASLPLTDWIPARWPPADVRSIELVGKTPINCLLLEQEQWSPAFAEAARGKGISVLGVIRPEAAADAAVDRAWKCGLTGIAIEGAHTSGRRAALAARARELGLEVIELPPRVQMDLSGAKPVIGTFQGVWPGVHTAKDGTAKAAPTGAPWIDTNSGFLRFVRSATGATIWVGSLPPEGEVIPAARYLQAIGDAAMVGARWIIALDGDFQRRLLERDPEAVARWEAMGEQLRFWEVHREWTLYPPAGGLAVVQDVESGALLSGGVLDMITARHTPLRVIPPAKLAPAAVSGARMAVNVNPRSLTDEQQEALRELARGGGTLLNAPPGWTFPPQRAEQITVDEGEIPKLDDIWRGVNGIVGRANLGVRLFNVATMRSELVADPHVGTVYLHLVNYSDYPVENVTIHPLTHYSKATLHAPGADPKDLEVFENGEIDVERIGGCAIVVLSGPTGKITAPAGH